MASSGGAEGEPEFQIAPMIDVLLVLLIFFMSIATTAVSRYDPTIDLPVAPDANKKEDSEGELVFNIAWIAKESRAVISFEEHVVEPKDIIPRLAALKAKAPEGKVRILIRSDGGTPVRFISSVIEAGAGAGISDVTFATLSR